MTSSSRLEPQRFGNDAYICGPSQNAIQSLTQRTNTCILFCDTDCLEGYSGPFRITQPTQTCPLSNMEYCREPTQTCVVSSCEINHVTIYVRCLTIPLLGSNTSASSVCCDHDVLRVFASTLHSRRPSVRSTPLALHCFLALNRGY